MGLPGARWSEVEATHAAEQKAIDRDAREAISHEMGHGREQITAVYLGR